MGKRRGERKRREDTLKRQKPRLGYYYIITDTKETESNYFLGLRDSIPEELQRQLVIKVSSTKTIRLLHEAINQVYRQPQFSEPWIVLDRDEVVDFDKIIKEAEKYDIRVAWSNPCIEIWFFAYFGQMPHPQSSTACCKEFEKEFFEITKLEYDKADRNIYKKLCEFGDEKKAITLASRKLQEHERNGICIPSKMCPGTTVFNLVEEIKEKISSEIKD